MNDLNHYVRIVLVSHVSSMFCQLDFFSFSTWYTFFNIQSNKTKCELFSFKYINKETRGVENTVQRTQVGRKKKTVQSYFSIYPPFAFTTGPHLSGTWLHEARTATSDMSSQQVFNLFFRASTFEWLDEQALLYLDLEMIEIMIPSFRTQSCPLTLLLDGVSCVGYSSLTG